MTSFKIPPVKNSLHEMKNEDRGERSRSNREREIAPGMKRL